MTTTTVNLASTPVVRNEFKPIPQGTYELELGDVSVKMPKDVFKEPKSGEKAEQKLKVPYIEVTPPEISVVGMEKANKDGELITAEHLNPMEIVSALQALRGERVKAYIRVKSETYAGKTQDKNEIQRFFSRETA